MTVNKERILDCIWNDSMTKRSKFGNKVNKTACKDTASSCQYIFHPKAAGDPISRRLANQNTKPPIFPILYGIPV